MAGDVLDGVALVVFEAAFEVAFELLDEEWDAVGAAEAMADGVLDGEFREDGVVVELDGEGVGDGAPGRGRGSRRVNCGVFDAGDEGAEVRRCAGPRWDRGRRRRRSPRQ